MADTTQAYQGTLVRVSISGAGSLREAEAVAEHLETALGVDGSTIFDTLGRWHGATEHGHVVEVCTSIGGVQLRVKDALARRVPFSGFTYFVTYSEVTCQEIF